MGLLIDKAQATKILLEEGRRAETEDVPVGWEGEVERLSQACTDASKTHIAFLGTALLAKATDINADAFAVKAGAKTSGAYSARSLGHGVLVPNAPKLGISLGVTGREPLNNQPYFRISRAVPKEILPLVKGSSRRPVEILCEILEQLDRVGNAAEARGALRAFIKVRRGYWPAALAAAPTSLPTDLEHLIELIISFVASRSEGGKRAQAAAAGIMDLFAGPDRVETGRINDPDRHLPGDVGVKSVLPGVRWESVMEVRDKPVSENDLILFSMKAAEAGVQKAAVLAVASRQREFSAHKAKLWAAARGVDLVVFRGWGDFVGQAVFWCPYPWPEAIANADIFIRNRLIGAEVSSGTLEEWDSSPCRATRPAS